MSDEAPAPRRYVLRRAAAPKSYRVDYARELNEEQKAVVFAPDGPTVVVAGAGSGKTRALVYRVSRLIEDGADPASLLLLTFTNRAAREMKRRVARDGLLVGAVGGGEGVEDVTDRKRADGGRDALAGQPAGVAGPIELLVVRVSDLGNTGEIRRPRNRGEKAPRLRDMAFHGTAFVLGKAALRDRQEPELLGEEERRVAPAAIAVRAREERLQAPARILRQHGRLVRNDDLFEKRLEVAGASGRRRVERLEIAGDDGSPFTSAPLEERERSSSLLGSEREVETVTDLPEPLLRKLLRLDEDALGNRDLSEIVKKRGRADLAQLFLGERHGGVRAVGGAVHDRGQRDRKCRDAIAVARGRRVALLDRHDRGPREVLEELPDRRRPVVRLQADRRV